MRQLEMALRPMTLIEDPKGKYADELRLFQGIPAVERTAGGRLWAAFYGCNTDAASDETDFPDPFHLCRFA